MKNSIVKKAPAILSRIILLPVIAFGFILAGIDLLFDKLKEPSRKKTYINSHYYRDFQAPYHRGILFEDSYRFYNEAKDANLEFQMMHPSDNSPDYIISRGKAYLFPMYPDIFYGIFYHDPDHEWKANLDGEPYSLDEAWDKHKAYVEIANQGMPCFLLVMRDYLQPRFDGTEADSDDFAAELLPSYVCIVDRYTDVIA